jgi:hypothetical protein
MYKITQAVVCFIFCVNFCFAQQKSISMEEANWDIQGQKFQFEEKDGKNSLYLERSTAIAKEVDFKNGMVEFDILFPESRKFIGFIWRVQKGNNFEEFYLRPHQSGNPDANQYTPVFNGNSGWQLYHGEGYSKPYAYKFDEWMHVKIVFKDQEAEFFIDDMEQPLFRALELKHKAVAGKLGFRATGPEGGAYFANFKYQVTEDITFKNPPIEQEELSPETISTWSVSSTFEGKTLEKVTSLQQFDTKLTNWESLQAENSGTINISRLRQRSPEVNTVFTKCIITSDKDQVKQMAFGYSDAVWVFCNDQLLYGGDNTFRSRDYRYLGTIGYFDAVYLPLKKGKNEIWIAVKEGFGGWGLKAKLADLEGLKFE